MTAGVQAQSLATYNLNVANSGAPTTTATNVTAGDFGWSPMANATLNGTYFTVPSGSTGEFTTYTTFTVTAAEGYLLDLDTLTFDFGGGRNGGDPYTARAQVRTSVDGFASNLMTTRVADNVQSTTATAAGSSSFLLPFSVDLSEFTSVSAITFRVYLADSMNTSTGTLYYTRMDNIALNGAVVSVIPEPSSVALLAGGFVGALVLMRRSRRQGA